MDAFTNELATHGTFMNIKMLGGNVRRIYKAGGRGQSPVQRPPHEE